MVISISNSMNVAMYYNNKDVRIEQQDIPKISEDEILVKVMASGICGSDVMEWYRIKKAPLVLGHEIAGIVEKTGENVDKFKPGDRVFVTHHVPCNACRYCLQGEHTICETLHSTKFYLPFWQPIQSYQQIFYSIYSFLQMIFLILHS